MNKYSVTQFNQIVGETLAINSNLFNVNVTGEISNLIYHQSGHVYFSLKDSKSSVKINFWKSNVAKMSYRLEDGMEIEVTGSISNYIPNGTYALNITQVRQVGSGAIQKLFEKNLEILKQQNLIGRKLPLPKYPERIAIITSKTGAALQDMLAIYKQAYPIVQIHIYNVAVQGSNIAKTIISALEKIYQNTQYYDTIIIARGGGSIEDLWGFNEIEIAYKITESPLPVISAIGHEINFVLTDFVADYRAPTPTAAASMSVPNKNELIQNSKIIQNNLVNLYLQKIQKEVRKIDKYKSTIVNNSPFIKINKQLEKLNILRIELRNLYQKKLNQYLEKSNKDKLSIINIYQHKHNYYLNEINKLTQQNLNNYSIRLNFELNRLKNKKLHISSNYNSKLSNEIIKLTIKRQSLTQNSIQQKLKDGYAIVQKNNHLINSVKSVQKDDELIVTLHDGILNVKVIGGTYED